MHFNGTVYYYHPQRRLVVDCDVSDPRCRAAVVEDLEDVPMQCRPGPEAEIVMLYSGMDEEDLEMNGRPQLDEVFFIDHIILCKAALLQAHGREGKQPSFQIFGT